MTEASPHRAMEHVYKETGASTGGVNPRERRFEIVASALMAMAVVATAYCAWQSTRWGGVQAIRFAEASTARVESDKAADAANVQMSYDANTFVQVALTFESGNPKAAKAVADTFIRDDFRTYVDEWLRLRSARPDEVPPSPFELKSYRNAQLEKSNKLEADAARKIVQAKEANQNSDDYILATVFFATVLFFAGISSKFEASQVRGAILIMAGIGLAIGFTRALTLPFH